jgi:hypothetical protein
MAQYYKISSVKRTSGTIGNFVCNFSNTPIEPGTYALVSGVFGNSFFNVNDYNNKIYFKEGSTNLTATLTNGFYNSTNFPANVKSALETISTSSGASLTYTVTVNSTTNKLVITPSSGNIQILMGTNTLNSAKYLTGFTVDTSSLSSLTGDSPINLTDSYSYNIRIDAHGVKNLLYDNNNNFYSFSVPILSNSLDVFTYEPQIAFCIQFENRVNQLRVTILNEDGDQMELLNDYYFILAKV